MYFQMLSGWAIVFEAAVNRSPSQDWMHSPVLGALMRVLLIKTSLVLLTPQVENSHCSTAAALEQCKIRVGRKSRDDLVLIFHFTNELSKLE